jgi:lipid-A-disaccharide synthase
MTVMASDIGQPDPSEWVKKPVLNSAFLVAGEASGDVLGAALMDRLLIDNPAIGFNGIGGPKMRAGGLESLFPMSDIAVMGLSAVARRLPSLWRRIRMAVDAVVAQDPDILILIDSPDFTHRVARRVRARAPHIPIVNYVSPSVWAWRPGRARRMNAYVDHILAILPFEPRVHERLGGPPCSYVGHPLVATVNRLRPEDRWPRATVQQPPVVLMLPGSRRGEVDKLLPLFKLTLDRIKAKFGGVEVLIPAVPHLADAIHSATRDWQVRPAVSTAEEDKSEAFRRADAALAASGTVSLELALAGVPMVIAYKLDWMARQLVRLNTLLNNAIIDIPSMVLPNLVLGRNVIPEYLDQQADAETLSATLIALMQHGPERSAQIAAFAEIENRMAPPDGVDPSQTAARIIETVAATAR